MVFFFFTWETGRRVFFDADVYVKFRLYSNCFLRENLVYENEYETTTATASRLRENRWREGYATTAAVLLLLRDGGDDRDRRAGERGDRFNTCKTGDSDG